MRENHLEGGIYCADPIDWKEFEESNQNFESILTDSKVLSDKVLRVNYCSGLLLGDIQYFAYYAAF